MTFLIAAAGTGGHVYPGLAVGSALVDEGVARDQILFVGGDRLEASVYPNEGFPFLQIEMRGLKRSLSFSNAALPAVARRAAARIASAMAEREIKVALGMGGYVTVPTAMAARKAGAVLMVAEQNAHAGLANRLAGRRALRQFVAFPSTTGLARGEWVGNPVRKPIRDFDRDALRAHALDRYELDPGLPVLGVFGGSLGAASLNSAVANAVAIWDEKPAQVLHLTGERHHDEMVARDPGRVPTWRRIAFETHMEDFYAASDLILARAGGSVAEITATGTPSILVPGSFGSTGHQESNARFLEVAGAAMVLTEDRLGELASLAGSLLANQEKLESMSSAALSVSRPEAAVTIARAMVEVT